jgi:hypothetical protein
MRKPTEERRKELELREELERLVNSDIAEITGIIDQAKNILPGRVTNFMDYDGVKIEADTKADDIVDSIAEFYLDKQIIQEIPYIQQKEVVDKITVSNLLFQMKTAEHAITKLLEEIDNGNLHPRTFEVLASLQRSKMEIVKHLAQFMVIMENNYKSLKEDYRVKKSEEPLSLEQGEDDTYDESKNTFQMRGGRHLIETLREVIPERKASAKPKERLKDGEGEGLEHQED